MLYVCGNKNVVKMAWVYTQTITGPVAEGADYFRRDEIHEEFWREIKKGQHILFVAPRRVGKSSVMKELTKDHPEEFCAFYENIESDSTREEFYKRLFILLIEHTGKYNKFKKGLAGFFKQRGLGEISAEGIKFEHKGLDYKKELLLLVEILGKEKGHIVIFLDEFPDVIKGVITNEGIEAARDMLQTLRSLRSKDTLRNFTFVFAGSIGIEHVVSELGRLSAVNDLHPIKISALSRPEGILFIQHLLRGASMKINDAVHEYLLDKIEHLLPYYFQLMIELCDKYLAKENRPDLTNGDIDRVFDAVVLEGRNFTDWESRLTDYLQKADARYCIGLLTRCAHTPSYTLNEAYDYAVLVSCNEQYKNLIDDVLVKDGYLVCEDNNYRFLSPFLKAWWGKRHPAFEIKN